MIKYKKRKDFLIKHLTKGWKSGTPPLSASHPSIDPMNTPEHQYTPSNRNRSTLLIHLASILSIYMYIEIRQLWHLFIIEVKIMAFIVDTYNRFDSWDRAHSVYEFEINGNWYAIKEVELEWGLPKLPLRIDASE